MNRESEKSLKAANQKKLITFMIVNVIGATVVVCGPEEIAEAIRKLTNYDWSLMGRLVGIPAVGAVAVGLLSWLTPTKWKEMLVFWRCGVRRLPSSEAFSVIARSDLRIDVKKLTSRLGPLPTENAQQTAVWYSIYRRHREEAAVTDAHGAYLLFRDMAAITPILLLTGVPLGLVVSASTPRIASLAIFFLVEFFVLVLAARNSGRRLVANVLAIEASSVESEKRVIIP